MSPSNFHWLKVDFKQKKKKKKKTQTLQPGPSKHLSNVIHHPHFLTERIRNYGKLLQLLHFLLRSVYQLNLWQNYEEMFTISHTYSPCVGGGEEEVDGTHLLAPGKFPCKIFPFSFVSHRQFDNFYCTLLFILKFQYSLHIPLFYRGNS